MIEINMVPVNNGDCIHIRFSDSSGIHNIVIDSGRSTAKRSFRGLLRNIYVNNETIDLLCFSHIDDDHIQAATQIIPEENFINQNFIKTVWLNVGNNIHPEESTNNNYELTVHSATKLYSALQFKNIPITKDITAGMKFNFGDAVIKILSPDSIRHNKYLQLWESDTHPLSVAKDTSVTNGDSIAFLLCLNNKSFLFLGDAFADVVAENLKCATCIGQAVFAKLSHHGSHFNINLNLLNTMKTSRFLVSSGNNSRHFTKKSVEIINSYLPSEEKWVYCNFKYAPGLITQSNIHLLSLDSKGIFIEDDIWIFSNDCEKQHGI